MIIKEKKGNHKFMKKMIAFFVLIFLLISINIFKQNDFSPFLNYSKLVLVSSQPLFTEQEYIKNGNDYYFQFANNEASKNILMENQNIKSYIFYYDKDYKLKDFIKSLDIIYKGGQLADNRYTIYYGYYGNYKDYRIIDGKKINFQLVHTSEEWILGFPLITTGY